MANAKISSLIADAADRLSERVENEREADAAALLEIIEEELNSARDEIEALSATYWRARNNARQADPSC